MLWALLTHAVHTVRPVCKNCGVGVKTHPFLKPEWFKPQGEKNASI